MKSIKDLLTTLLEGTSSNVQPSIVIYQMGANKYVKVPLYVQHNSNDTYSYYEYTVLVNKYNYEDLVDIFIKMIYSDKEMFAVINNYLLNPADEDSYNEFTEMQSIRKEAKDLAKEILANYSL